VRLGWPDLMAFSFITLLVVGIALWPAQGGVQAQEKAPQLQPPTAPPLPPVPVAPPQPTKTPPAVGNFTTTAVRSFSLSAVARFKFNIDPKTPLNELLPVAPISENRPVSPQGEDLARVPEVLLQKPLARDVPTPKAMEQTARTIARINHLNQKKSDRFMEALLETRADLKGLPVAMGDACRTTGERSREFARAVALVRQALNPVGVVNISSIDDLVIFSDSARVTTAQPVPATPQPTPAPPQPAPSVPQKVPAPPKVAVTVKSESPPVQADELKTFWERFARASTSQDRAESRHDRRHEELVACARVAALMQVLAPESAELRLGLVKYLAGVSQVEATRALARLALFSAEDEIRAAALDALKVRRERDYTALLLDGLRYPLSAVSRRAGEALVKLERTDLVPKLVDLLDEPDPRAPTYQEINHQRVPTVRELVRINHHKNCLLCHAPGNTSSVSPDTLTAAVPMPSESLASPSQGYQSSSPDIVVRVDVTYLRQDFSLRLPVADANPWPEMQRFDFLVRTRVLTDKELKAYEELLGKRAAGEPSPYHRAILATLRELTGKDTEPTPQAWRRLLRLPAPEARLQTVRR
jgi:hypothetical protein